MATPKEVSGRIDSLFNEWSGGFTPLFFAVQNMRREMYIRIFGIDTGRGRNSAGRFLPTKPYTPAYAKIKRENGRPPLELTGFLKRSFANNEGAVYNQGFGSAIYIQADESGKVEGLQKLYGPIFQPTKEEQDEMLQLHAELLVEQISIAISKP
jgi:hypothetical protein